MGTVPNNRPAGTVVDGKSHFRYTFAMAETALVVLLPELEPTIGDLRRRHTPSGARGMPAHVTLIVPFADTADVGACTEEVARALEPFAPFKVAFRETARFAGTLYLEPEPAEPFVAMTEALVQAFPDFPPYGGVFDEIVPHATAATGDDALISQAEASLPRPLDVTLRVERVWLFENAPEGWRRHTAFPLDRRKRV
jgi:2'-5' RNA ligase